MCGIIGYTGEEKAIPILLSGLEALSYRGYDSAGISVCADQITTLKSSGRLSRLVDKVNQVDIDDRGCGIGHSRWATHGAPTDTNAHPHSTSNLSLVHNGIIENYSEISDFLRKEGYSFVSETDTEIAACLIDYYYIMHNDPVKAIFSATSAMRGAYAFAIIFNDRLSEIYAIRNDSPLIVSCGDDGCYVASDITALVGRCTEYYRPDNHILAVLKNKTISFINDNGEDIYVKASNIDWNVKQAQRGGYDHFMLKEINEEPEALEQTYRQYIKNGLPHFDDSILKPQFLKDLKRIHIIGCGTAMHAGLIGKNIIERLVGIPVGVEIASEFRYRKPIVRDDELVVFISQSGETADTLAALRYVKSLKVPNLSLVNVIGSTIACESDTVFYTYAGPEIAVASTKAYLVQCCILYLLAAYMGLEKGTVSESEAAQIASVVLNDVPKCVADVIKMNDEICRASEFISSYENLFYIGRCIDYDICAEGSLKLKEISYIHSEAFAAGELKHGTISLIDHDTPVIALLTEREVCEKTITGMREVAARGAKIIAICSSWIRNNYDFEADVTLVLPGIEENYDIFPAATLMQLLAYHTAVIRGNDVDKPRNLAKSVTVE